MAPPSVLAREAVRRARANGHKVFLCTGRNMPVIGKEILDLGFDGIIASAGSHVEVNGNVLFDSLLPEEVIQECLFVFHEHRMYCRIETPEGVYTDPQMEHLLKTAKPDKGNSELVRMQKELELGIHILRRPKNIWQTGLNTLSTHTGTVRLVLTGRLFQKESIKGKGWKSCANIMGLT